MDHASFFKLQAKNLLKDFKTRQKVFNEDLSGSVYEFTPRFFDIDEIIIRYDFSEEEIESFSLMKAQHFISQFVGFKKWNKLIVASSDELELAKFLFDNQHRISIDEWEDYIVEAEHVGNTSFEAKAKLAILEELLRNNESDSLLSNEIRLSKGSYMQLKEISSNKNRNVIDEIITELPLVGETRKDFIETADEVLESVLLRIQIESHEKIRKYWNAEEYIDEGLLDPTMLPISKSYALSLIDSFLVHHVLNLCE